MDGVPVILLVALALTWMAWLAARRKNQQLAAQRVAQQEQNSYTLDARESAGGRGFDVVGPDGLVRSADSLDWREDGLMVADVVDFRPAADAGGGPDFAPGARVELIHDDEEPGRVDVWNADMTARAGRLPGGAAALLLSESERVASESAQHDPDAGLDHAVAECLVLWEHTDRTTRTGLRLLLVREDMQLDA